MSEAVKKTGSESFGRRLARLRKARGMTQQDLGNKIGFTASGVSNWEVGVCYPRTGIANRLADMFGVEISWLLNGYDTEDVSSDWEDVKKDLATEQLAFTIPDAHPIALSAPQERQDGPRAMRASDFTSAVEIAVAGLTEPEAIHAATIAIALLSPCRISDEQIDAILSAADNIKRIRRAGNR